MTITTELSEPGPAGYTLEAELSQDEWSTLYRGHCCSDQTPVLVRVVAPLFTTDQFFGRRFKQLTRQNAGLEHPNILPTYEADQETDRLYLIQDWVEARPLTEVIAAEGPLSIQRVQFIAAQIASALDYAHQKSITHGDLSAHQIYLGPRDHVWIANFGLTQLLFGANFVKHGWPKQAVETLAPERARGEGPSRQADLYSLGVLCYQMLSKQLPFSGPSSAVLHAQAYKQARPLHQVNPGIPVAVSETIDRMLSKSVDVRYNTGAEFARALLMAYHRKKTFRSYDRLVPLVDREAHRESSLATRKIIRAFIGLVTVGAIIALSIWAGYELGVKHSPAETSFPDRIISAVVAVSSPTSRGERPAAISPRPSATPTTIAPSPTTEEEALVVLADSLLPTRKPTRIENRRPPAASILTATLTTSPPPALSSASLRTSAPSPTPPPVAPDNQSIFVFHNPTGHDLVLDINGPTTTSVLIPPYLQEEIALAPGQYQYNVHTPTGNWLPAKVGSFNLAGGGQIVEKDYYSEHDTILD